MLGEGHKRSGRDRRFPRFDCDGHARFRTATDCPEEDIPLEEVIAKVRLEIVALDEVVKQIVYTVVRVPIPATTVMARFSSGLWSKLCAFAPGRRRRRLVEIGDIRDGGPVP
jgi:hypothetical protein